MLHHCLAQGGDNIAAEDYILLYGRISQVEVAVFKTCGLVGLAAAVYFKRQLVIAAAAENFDLFGNDLDITGGELGVFARALANGALDGDGALFIYALYDLHHILGLDDDLRRAVKIADDDKCKVLSYLADVLHPSDDLDLFSDVFNAELIAGMGS